MDVVDRLRIQIAQNLYEYFRGQGVCTVSELVVRMSAVHENAQEISPVLGHSPEILIDAAHAWLQKCRVREYYASQSKFTILGRDTGMWRVWDYHHLQQRLPGCSFIAGDLKSYPQTLVLYGEFSEQAVARALGDDHFRLEVITGLETLPFRPEVLVD